MTFDVPLPFSEAAKLLAEKGLLPTDMSSAELRDIDAGLRNRSVVMARNTKAGILQTLKDGLGEIIGGKENAANIQARLQDHFDELGYDPQTGFPDDQGSIIPPAEAGSLRDLSSNPRLNLVLQTNTRLVGNEAFKRAGQTDFALYAWPCYELVRVGRREVPRGERRTKTGIVDDPANGWPARWEKAGGQFFDGRMIARKDDPVWAALGNSAEFSDAMDVDVPPFAYNSGMGWKELPREECVRLGVIGAEEEIAGPQAERDAAIETAARFDPEFLKALRDDLQVEIAAGKARLQSLRTMSAAALQLGPVSDFEDVLVQSAVPAKRGEKLPGRKA